MKISIACLALAVGFALSARAQTPAPSPTTSQSGAQHLNEQATQVLSQPSVSSADTLAKTLLTNSSALFSAFQHRKVLGFLAGITPEFTYIGPEGVLSIEQLAGIVEGCTLTSYAIAAPQLHVLTPDAAVLVYRHHQDATCNGKPLPSEMLGSDTYVRKDGRWLITLHTETVPQ